MGFGVKPSSFRLRTHLLIQQGSKYLNHINYIIEFMGGCYFWRIAKHHNMHTNSKKQELVQHQITCANHQIVSWLG